MGTSYLTEMRQATNVSPHPMLMRIPNFKHQMPERQFPELWQILRRLFKMTIQLFLKLKPRAAPQTYCRAN